MPLTLDDIMNFMTKDKEERAKEREADKQEIKELISKGVKDEVEAAMEPIKERQLQVEKVQDEMQREFKGMLEEVREFRNQITTSSNQHFPGLPQPESSLPSQISSGQVVSVKQSEETEVKKIISLARRTVGLHKINQADLRRMRQEQYGGASSEEEVKFLAVQEYLKCELKIDSNTLQQMKIEKIFAPAKLDPQCLYVTFMHEESVSKIYRKTRCMRKESRILNYIPRQFYSRFRDVSEFEYNLREQEKCQTTNTTKIQTRVKMGFNDLELYKRERGEVRWQKVKLPDNLSKIDMSTPSASASLSPAPGRPGQDRGEKRGRVSTGSQSGVNTPKASRTEDEAETDVSKEDIEKMRKDRQKHGRRP